MFTKQSLSLLLCTDVELNPLVYIRVSLTDLVSTTQTQLESATCLWFPQLRKHFWNGWSHREPGDKDVIWTGEHPITAEKGHELKLGSFWQIHEFHSSSVMWRNWEESPVRQSFTTELLKPLRFRFTSYGTTEKELANQGAAPTQAAPFQSPSIHLSISTATAPGAAAAQGTQLHQADVKVMFCTFYFNKDIRQTA